MAVEGKQQLRSFVEVPWDSHFPIQNLPFGVIQRRGSPETRSCPAVAIGDFALDLAAVSDADLFDEPVLSDSPYFRQETFNTFLGMGRPAWKEARATLQRILSADEPVLSDNEALRKKCLVPMSDVEMLLPITVGDYTDFFCSVHHARNCGFIFRGPQTPVNPNWYWSLMQQLAHHTVNGCNLRPGDMFATGTLSGPEPDSLGCLLELTWNGLKEISWPSDIA